MKNRKLVVGIAIIALAFTSCKDEKETQAKKSVDTYVVYVDSIGTIETENAKTNWQGIDAVYQLRMSEAEAGLVDLRDDKMEQERVEASKAKYEALKAKYEAQIVADVLAANPQQQLRNTMFGAGVVGDDMNFSWVNKNNILKVYDTFFESYKANKSNFTREDYDEVKLMYEALDSRKNTVENEGLSSEDNGKIASIKFKIAPMFKLNRIGAKSREMAKAKE